MDKVPIEISALLREIEKALEAKLYYLAIAVALSVPDICACLEFDPSNPPQANWKTYTAWCRSNVESRFINLKGIDLYRLRCGVLHFGHFGHRKARFDRIMFIGPESQIKAHDTVINVAPGVCFGGISAEQLHLSGKILQLDVLPFCQIIMDAARAWGISKKQMIRMFKAICRS